MPIFNSTKVLGDLVVTGDINTNGDIKINGENLTAEDVGAAPLSHTHVYADITGTVPTWNQNTSGTAAVSTAATITHSSTNSAFKVPFANTTGASATGNYGLLQDTENTFTYNPSTNTLIAGIFSGSGASLTSLPAGNLTGNISIDRLPTITVAKGGTGATDAATARTNLGLGNVDNTSDANKPVSTATQTALDAKLNLTGGTLTGLLKVSASTVVGNAFVPTTSNETNKLNILSGSTSDGGINGIKFHENTDGFGMSFGYDGTGSGAANKLAWYTHTNTQIMELLNDVSNTSLKINGNIVFNDGYHPNADTLTTARTLTIGSTGKTFNGSADVSWSLTDIGLGNVNNTSDANKPVSTAQQTALNLKVNTSAVGAVNGVASLDSGGKVPFAQLPSSVIGGMRFVASTNLSAGTTEANAIGLNTIFSELTYANFTTTGVQAVGSYRIVTNPGFVKELQGTDGSVAYFRFGTSAATIGEEEDDTPPVYLEKGDWIVLNSTLIPAAGAYIYYFSIVNNTYADATPFAKGVVTLSQSISLQDDTNAVITESVLQGLLGTGADQLAVGNHTHAIADVTNLQDALNLKAPLASPTFTGNVTAPNVLVGDYIYHNGDTNTYIRFIGSDDMQLMAGGRQMLRMAEGTDPDRLRFVTDNDWTDSSGNWNISGILTVNGDINVGAQTGTWITSDAMADSIGWNTAYGTYIGSNIGGTHYLRGNGTFSTGGSIYNLWHAGNDGSGSGLDADLLDGLDSTAFLRSNVDSTLTTTLFVDSTQGGSIAYVDSAGTYIPRPSNASYKTTTATVTGALTVRLPGATPSDMMSFWIDVMDYAGNPEGESVSIYVYGYAYTTSSPFWTNVGALILSDRTDRDYNVRFGYDGTNHVVCVGETTSTWNYPQVIVRDFQAGYDALATTFDDGWSITFLTTLPSIGQTASNNYPVAKDSGLLNGFASATATTANTIVRRDANGYIYGVYINSSRANETTAAASYIYDTGDGWLRKKTLANAQTEIVTSAAVTAHAPSKTGTGASGTWGINVSGSAATLTTARNINGVSFNGSADITITADPNTHQHTIADVTNLQDALDAKLNLTGGTVSGNLTLTGQLNLSEDHFIHRKFVMTNVDNLSPAYIILVRNAGGNDVNGRIAMDRTSGLRHAVQFDIIVSAGSSLPPVGTIISHATAGADGAYGRLVTLTYNSLSYVAVQVVNPDNYYESTGAYFTGRIKSTDATNIFTVVTDANVSNVSAFAVNGQHRIDADKIFTDGYHPNADTLTTARNIALAGDVTGSANFDGSGNISITATIADDSHNHVIGNVDGLQDALNLKANLASPALTGTPTAPTASFATNTTQLATTAFVQTALSGLVASAPTTLDTLNELAAALGDDPNFATTVANDIGTKVTANTAITAGTATKITYDTKGLVTSGTTLAAADIPDLNASKITAGTVATARLGSGTANNTTFLRGDNTWATPSAGVTSVAGTGTVSGITLSGSVTSTGNLTLGGTFSAPISSINDSTSSGQALVKITNPVSAGDYFLRLTRDGSSVFTSEALTAATFRSAIGAGTGNGTVTGVTGTSPVVSSGGTAPAISLAAGYGDTLNPYASKTANTFLAAPNGSAGTPSFRTLVAADIPAHTHSIANVTGLQTALDGKAPLASPTFTGTVTASTIELPTPSGFHAKIFYGQFPNPTGSLNSASGDSVGLNNFGQGNQGIIIQTGAGDTGGLKITDDGVFIFGASDTGLFSIIDEDSNISRFSIDSAGNTTVNGRLMVSNNTATITANTTLSAVHRGATIFCKNSSAITITVPSDASNATFKPGTEITFIRRGAGTVTIATTNISLFSVGSGTANLGRRAIANQNEGVILIKETGNTWQLIGAL
jgi:hypothetical protein